MRAFALYDVHIVIQFTYKFNTTLQWRFCTSNTLWWCLALSAFKPMLPDMATLAWKLMKQCTTNTAYNLFIHFDNIIQCTITGRHFYMANVKGKPMQRIYVSVQKQTLNSKMVQVLSTSYTETQPCLHWNMRFCERKHTHTHTRTAYIFYNLKGMLVKR